MAVRSILVVFVLFVFCGSVCGQYSTYRVFSVSGEVLIERADGEWMVLEKDRPVSLMDKVQLGERACLEIINYKKQIFVGNKSGVQTVQQLINQRRSFWDSIVMSAFRTSIGVTARDYENGDVVEKVGEGEVRFDFVNLVTKKKLSSRNVREAENVVCFLRIINSNDFPVFCDVVFSLPDGERVSYLNGFFEVKSLEEVDFDGLPVCLNGNEVGSFVLYFFREMPDDNRYRQFLEAPAGEGLESFLLSPGVFVFNQVE